MKFIVPLFTGSLMCAVGLLAQAAQTLDEPLLSRLRAEASRTHPSAEAGKQRAAASGQDVRAVRLWDDPMVGLGFMAADTVMRADQGDLIFGVEQKLPKPGMFDAQRRKAEAMHRAEVENSRGSALAAGAAAARNAIELALADESITLQQTQITWLIGDGGKRPANGRRTRWVPAWTRCAWKPNWQRNSKCSMRPAAAARALPASSI